MTDEQRQVLQTISTRIKKKTYFDNCTRARPTYPDASIKFFGRLPPFEALPAPPQVQRSGERLQEAEEFVEWQIRMPTEDFRRCPTRREFRALLGEVLNALYQEALGIWERVHPEAEG